MNASLLSSLIGLFGGNQSAQGLPLSTIWSTGISTFGMQIARLLPRRTHTARRLCIAAVAVRLALLRLR
jgi:hypothetical protein